MTIAHGFVNKELIIEVIIDFIYRWDTHFLYFQFVRHWQLVQ